MCCYNCRQLLSGQRWWKRLHSAVSSQHLLSPLLTIAVVFCLIAGWYSTAFKELGSAPQAGVDGKGGLGLTELFLCPFPMHTRRSGRSLDDPALHQAPTKGAEQLQCHECLSCLHCTPRSCCSPTFGALFLTICSFHLTQVTTLCASSLERLVEGQAEVRVTQDAIVAIFPSHT